MKKNQGIEQFRVILAMMVVAIHCLPLHRLWPDGDILITLTLFRIAVPLLFYDQRILRVQRLSHPKQLSCQTACLAVY